MTARVAVPAAVGARASEVASGLRIPVVPRDAATVALVRPARGGIEVLLLGRGRAMDFAPGAHVFPGGSVDPRDADRGVSWAGPQPSELGSRLGVSPDRCRALVCAAIRETFEESGVLLAGRTAESVVSDTADLMRHRRALLAGDASLRQVLRSQDLLLRADLLTPWARWITPETSDRRFDTWFFAAALPEGQVLADVGAEADVAEWMRPDAALDAARAGKINLLPPTAVTLAELAALDDLGGILAQRRAITPLLPSVTVEDGQAWLTMPDGVEYPL